MNAIASKNLYERACRAVPSGTHSNSRVTGSHLRYFQQARGDTLVDVDGNEWLDFVMGNGAVILGHGNEEVRQAVATALADGLGAGVESELSVTAAELFLSMVPTADQVRFTNTGTGAAMHAVHVARAVTGKPNIAKIEGAYHGWWDEVFVSTWPDLMEAGTASSPNSLPGGGGLRQRAIEETVVVPFNDLEAAEQILTHHQNRIAALLIEPVMIDVGFILPEPGYLDGLRALTTKLGILLIFDELLTGFRLGKGGAQERFGVLPDLSIWSKGLANGFPTAILAGKREFMERTVPGASNASFVGTFNGYRPGLAACHATLQQLQDGRIIAALEQRSQTLVMAFNAEADKHGVPVKLHSGGGHLQPYFVEVPVRDYRSAAATDTNSYAIWHDVLAEKGIIVAPKPLLHSAFSAAHSDRSLERFLEASGCALAKIAEAHHV